MHAFAKLALVYSTFVSFCALAAPIEYDTPDAHIVVIRPMDQWSGADLEKLDKQTFDDREYSPSYWPGKKDYFRMSDGEESLAVQFRSRYPNIEYIKWGAIGTSIRRPAAINPKDMPNLIQAQNHFYRLAVISQGNPQTLPSRIRSNQAWSGILTIATIGLSGIVGGGNLAAAIAGSPIPNEIANMPSDAKQSIIGVKTPNLDHSKYSAIEIYKTDISIVGASPGQIIIAYKKERSQAVVDMALSLAIGSTIGLDTTKEGVLASRAADLAERQALWNECVADGKCKGGE